MILSNTKAEISASLNKDLQFKDKMSKSCTYILYGIFVVLSVMALMPSLNMLAALAIAPFMLWLFFFDEFYLLAAIFLFFGEQLVVMIGVPIARLYTVMMLAKAVFFDKTERKLNVFLVPAILVLVMYAFFALPNADNSVTIREYIAKGVEPPSDFVLNAKWILKYLVDFAFLIFLVCKFHADKDLFERFCFCVVICMLISGVYGIRSGNVYNYLLGYDTSGQLFGVTRYMGSFNDPNYMGFFINLSMFFVIKLPKFKNLIVRTIVLTVLYYYLIASGSLSGLLFNIVGMVVFIVLRYKSKSFKILITAGLIGALGVFLVLNIPPLRNIGAVQNMITRVESQFADAEGTSVDTATSGRETHWIQYMDYYKGQSLVKKLFGGNIHMTSSVDPYFTENFGNVAHQAYIGFLLCFGAVGAAVFLLSFVIKAIFSFINYIKTQDDYYLLLCISSFIWTFYGFGFDYFADWRFMLFYFL